MALLAVITSKEEYDKLPDAIKSEYKEEGEIYILDVTQAEVEINGKKHVYGMEDVHGLKNALQSERSSTSELKKQLKTFEKIKDPEAALAAIQKLEAMGDDPDIESRVKEQVESTKRQLEKKFGDELKVEQDKNAELDTEINRLLVDQQAMTTLSKYKLVDGGATLLMPHVKSKVVIVKNDEGKREARVLDDDGKTHKVSLRKGETGFMGIDELIENMSKDKTYSVAFQGTEASGTAGKKKGGSSQEPPKDPPKDPNDRSKGIQTHTQFNNPIAGLQAAREAEAQQT